MTTSVDGPLPTLECTCGEINSRHCPRHNEPTPEARSLTEIVSDRLNTNANRAAECVRALDGLSWEDIARPDFRAAAQTFALLAIADALTAPGSGSNVAEIIAAAGGIQA